MIKFPHNLEQSSELHRLTIPLMQEHNISLTPSNYALWYTYKAGDIQQLNDTLNNVISKNEPVTQKLCDELYRVYIADPDEDKLKALQKNVLQVLEAVHNSIAMSGKETSRFEQSFSQHREKLSASNVNVSAVKEVVNSLVEDTQAMQTVSKKLHTQLEQSNNEVEQLRQQLEVAQQSAMTDPLTGLSNRRAFDTQVDECLEEYDTACLLVLDIDHFKKFNDTYGHLIGDKVLQLVATTITQCIKGRDIAIRFGGEEFAVLLPGTPLTGAVRVAEEIRTSIEKTRLVKREDHSSLGNITISAGAAQHRKDEQLASFIERADTALYKSKNAGRNCVTTETDI
jgi:diguanylate cyclase